MFPCTGKSIGVVHLRGEGGDMELRATSGGERPSLPTEKESVTVRGA